MVFIGFRPYHHNMVPNIVTHANIILPVMESRKTWIVIYLYKKMHGHVGLYELNQVLLLNI